MKTYAIIFMIVSFAVSATYASIDYYPKLIVAELLTASWSDEADLAYSGLDEIMSHYHHGEVVPVRFYTNQNGGQYSSPSIENLIQGYSVTEFPSLIVNGKSRISGTELPVSSGLPYNSLIETEYYSVAPIKIDILEFNEATGSVEMMITMLSETENLQNVTARFILIEEDVDASVKNLARAVNEETFSISGHNETVNISTDFSIEPSWNEDNLFLLVYVREQTGEIIQAASSYSTPDHYLRAAVPNQRMDIGPSSGVFDVDYFTLFNLGYTIDLTINVSMDDAPDSWFLTYCDDEGLCYFGPLDFSLEQNGYRKFYANVIPDGAGMMDYSFVLQSLDLADGYTIPFRYISYDVDYLIIDGDGWADYEVYPSSILQDNQYTYGIWNAVFADVNQLIMQYFNNLIWLSGEREPALSQIEISFLQQYLDDGNNLFISGQNIGKHLTENPLYENSQFYFNYLNAQLDEPNTDYREIAGVEGDEITDGLYFSIVDGDGADNQQSPEKITLGHQNGSEILHYPDQSVAGISSILSSNAKIVYLAFGFEAIDNNDDRRDLLLNSLYWLQVTSVEDVILPEESYSLKLYPSYPNPFFFNSLGNSLRAENTITIPFSLSQRNDIEEISLEIYNIKGQLVRRLTDIDLGGQKGHFTWDGRDSYNRPVVSGVYFYTLTNGRETQARKLLIIN